MALKLSWYLYSDPTDIAYSPQCRPSPGNTERRFRLFFVVTTASAGPTTSASSAIDRPRRLVAPGYAASRHDYAPSLAAVVDKSYGERMKELEAKKLAATKKGASVLGSVSTAPRDGAVDKAMGGGVGSAVESPGKGVPASHDTEPTVNRAAEGTPAVRMDSFAAVGAGSSGPSSGPVRGISGGVSPANGSGSNGAVGSAGLLRLSTPVAKRSGERRTSDAPTACPDEAAGVGGSSRRPSCGGDSNVDGKGSPAKRSSSPVSVGSVEHRRRSPTQRPGKFGGSRRAPQAVYTSSNKEV